MNADQCGLNILQASILAMIFGSLGLLWGVYLGVESGKRQAIKAGVAHWTINPVTGEKSFQYKVKP